jgi:Outer membrane protein beta-barrel domain
MKKLIALLSMSLFSFALPATADSYFSVGFGTYEFDLDIPDLPSGAKATNDIKGIEGVLGFESSPNIAWEARLGLGLGSSNTKVSYQGDSISTDLEYKVDSYFSGYFRPQYKTSNLQIYGLLGYTSVGGEASYEGESEDTSDDGFSYGVGAGVIFGKVNSLNVEWKNLAKTDSGDITGFSVSFQRNF